MENPRPNAPPVSDHQCLKMKIAIPQSDVTDRPWRLSSSLLIDGQTKEKVREFLQNELPRTEPTLAAWMTIKEHLKQMLKKCGRRVAREHTTHMNAVATKIRILDRSPQKTALVEQEIAILKQKHMELMRETSLDA